MRRSVARTPAGFGRSGRGSAADARAWPRARHRGRARRCALHHGPVLGHRRAPAAGVLEMLAELLEQRAVAHRRKARSRCAATAPLSLASATRGGRAGRRGSAWHRWRSRIPSGDQRSTQASPSSAASRVAATSAAISPSTSSRARKISNRPKAPGADARARWPACSRAIDVMPRSRCALRPDPRPRARSAPRAPTAARHRSCNARSRSAGRRAPTRVLAVADQHAQLIGDLAVEPCGVRCDCSGIGALNGRAAGGGQVVRPISSAAA